MSAPRIEIVDPLAYADAASTVLRAAWLPPCMHYTSEYLSWQMGFPGEEPAKLAIAFLDGMPIGCAGVTPRRLVQAGAWMPAYVLSFVGVAPLARGRGLAGALYESLLDVLSWQRPVIAFAIPESSGERLLMRAFTRGSFTHHPLRQCRAVGFLSRPSKEDDRYSVETDSMEFASACSHGLDSNVILNAPTTEELRHYRSDPRGRSMLLIRRRDGRPAATAMRVVTEIVTAAELQPVVMLESLNLLEQSTDALRAAFTFAARDGHATSVVAPNISHLDAAVVKAAGARLLPSVFNAHLFARSPNAQPMAESTNLEVI